MDNKAIKVIAFYLPQFHTIPENDKAYGKGFTEWTNVRKAQPLFEGHSQPKVPFNNNYYNLLDCETMRQQAKLAQEYGVYGFCYYHYWFKGGRKLLEKPIEMMLKDKLINIPFCLCWANENWSKRWDGGNNELIVSQDYGNKKDIGEHVAYLKQFFDDERYIRIEGKPLLVIYKPELIPNVRRYIKKIRTEAVKQGIREFVIACQYPKFYIEGVNLDLFDYYIQFQPRFIKENELNENKSKLERTLQKWLIAWGLREPGKRIRSLVKSEIISDGKVLEKRNYDDDWKKIIEHQVNDKRLIAGGFTDWDNTPRNKNGLVYLNSSPNKFKHYMSMLVKKVENEYEQKIVFINAWNEWAEGAYLEPDEANGYAYLEALREVLQSDVH